MVFASQYHRVASSFIELFEPFPSIHCFQQNWYYTILLLLLVPLLLWLMVFLKWWCLCFNMTFLLLLYGTRQQSWRWCKKLVTLCWQRQLWAKQIIRTELCVAIYFFAMNINYIHIFFVQSKSFGQNCVLIFFAIHTNNKFILFVRSKSFGQNIEFV